MFCNFCVLGLLPTHLININLFTDQKKGGCLPNALPREWMGIRLRDGLVEGAYCEIPHRDRID